MGERKSVGLATPKWVKSQNPLGIIALFISLIYGMAGIVAGTAGLTGMEANERAPLIWFLVVFPVLVLGVFTYLVVSHHEKLYAPHDFKDEKNFLDLLSPKEQRKRLAAEVADNNPSTPDEAGEGGGAGSSPPGVVERLLGRPHARYFVAEELALRKLESELHVAIQRGVYVDDQEADGLALDGRTARIVEVKAPSLANLSQSVRLGVKALQVKTRALRETVDKGVRVVGTLVVVVGSQDAVEPSQRRVDRVVAEHGERVDVRVYAFDELAKEFGLLPTGSS